MTRVCFAWSTVVATPMFLLALTYDVVVGHLNSRCHTHKILITERESVFCAVFSSGWNDHVGEGGGLHCCRDEQSHPVDVQSRSDPPRGRQGVLLYWSWWCPNGIWHRPRRSHSRHAGSTREQEQTKVNPRAKNDYMIMWFISLRGIPIPKLHCDRDVN